MLLDWKVREELPNNDPRTSAGQAERSQGTGRCLGCGLGPLSLSCLWGERVHLRLDPTLAKTQAVSLDFANWKGHLQEKGYYCDKLGLMALGSQSAANELPVSLQTSGTWWEPDVSGVAGMPSHSEGQHSQPFLGETQRHRPAWASREVPCTGHRDDQQRSWPPFHVSEARQLRLAVFCFVAPPRKHAYEKQPSWQF